MSRDKSPGSASTTAERERSDYVCPGSGLGGDRRPDGQRDERTHVIVVPLLALSTLPLVLDSGQTTSRGQCASYRYYQFC